MVVSSRAKIGPSTTVLMTERAPHVSDIRNQESSIRVNVKEKSKEKKRESINTHNRKAKNYTPNGKLSSTQGGGERRA